MTDKEREELANLLFPNIDKNIFKYERCQIWYVRYFEWNG